MSQVNEVRKVALFKSSHGSGSFVSQYTEYVEAEYVRLSEILDITFPPLPDEVQITNEINHINKEVEELKERTIRKIEELEQRKQELLAIGFDGEIQ